MTAIRHALMCDSLFGGFVLVSCHLVQKGCRFGDRHSDFRGFLYGCVVIYSNMRQCCLLLFQVKKVDFGYSPTSVTRLVLT